MAFEKYEYVRMKLKIVSQGTFGTCLFYRSNLVFIKSNSESHKCELSKMIEHEHKLKLENLV